MQVFQLMGRTSTTRADEEAVELLGTAGLVSLQLYTAMNADQLIKDLFI